MKGYGDPALRKFNHPAPLRPQHAPYDWIRPAYGSHKPQTAIEASSATPLDKAETLCIQSINSTFMYYGRGVDPCILVALNESATEQAAPTTDILDETTFWLC